MHPDRGIVRTYRQSVILSTIPDDQNTLTLQYTNTNDAPRDPIPGPVTIMNTDKCLYKFLHWRNTTL